MVVSLTYVALFYKSETMTSILGYLLLQAIRCLLIEPFPESALNEEAGKMLMEDYESYYKYARYYYQRMLTKHPLYFTNSKVIYFGKPENFGARWPL